MGNPLTKEVCGVPLTHPKARTAACGLKPGHPGKHRSGWSQGDQKRFRQYQAAWHRERRQYWGRIIDAFKLVSGCRRCGFRSDRVGYFDLDHVDRTTKTTALSTLAGQLDPRNLEHRFLFAAELQLCQVLCVACHREKTANEHRSEYYPATEGEEGMTLNQIPGIIEEFANGLLHHTRKAVEEAEARVAALYKSEEAKIAAEARAAVKSVVDAAKADAPEIEAALKKGAQDALAALELALKARGL